MYKSDVFWKHMEGNVGRLSMSSTDEDSPYDTPRSTESSLSPTTPPKLGLLRTLSACCQCGGTIQDLCSLPCLHTVCLGCVQNKGKNVVCPECHAEAPSTTSGTNVLIPMYGTMNTFRSDKKEIYCTSCKTETLLAVGKCADCNSFLCTSCMAAHNLMHCFHSHKVINFHRSIDFYDRYNEESVNCVIHPSEYLKYFCFSCNEIMCQSCVEETHIDGTHLVEDLKCLGSTVISRMRQRLNESQNHAADFDFCRKCNSQTLTNLNGQYADVIYKIHQMYEHYSAQLVKHKEQQLAIVEAAYNRMVTVINKSIKISDDASQRLTKISDFISKLVSEGNTAQCLMYKKILEDEISHLSTIAAKPVFCSLKFETEENNFANSLAKSFGHVVYEINDVINDSIISPDPYHPKVDFPVFPFRYDKWSSSWFDDVKAITDFSLNEDINQTSRTYHIKSNISRQTITYNWKFGAYGSLQGQFTEPNGVCINTEGDIIIADTNNNRVQVFDRGGKFKFCFGDGQNGDNGSLLFPNRVAVMEKSGDIIVTERAPTHQVQVYNQYGQFIRKFGANVLQHPRAVAVDKEGHIIVVECKVMRVIIFDIMGNIKHQFTCRDTLHFPNGVAVNEKQEIFISDNRIHCVVVYNYQGVKLRTIGGEGWTNYPIGVMLNKAGNVIVADNHNNFNLTVFTQEGQFVSAVESKVKHAQCYDAAISSDGVVALTSKDYRVYVYLTSF